MHLGTTLAAAMLFAVSPLLSQTSATPANAPAAISAKPDAIVAMQAKLDDWAQLNRYRADNAALAAPAAGEQRVVFYGDSITDGWGRQPGTGSFFPGNTYDNRGI